MQTTRDDIAAAFLNSYAARLVNAGDVPAGARRYCIFCAGS